MSGFGKFLLGANLLLSITFAGVGFALWHNREDLTNAPAKPGQDPGLLAQEKEKLDLAVKALQPAAREYESAVGKVELQEDYVLQDRAFFNQEIEHVRSGAMAGSSVRRFTFADRQGEGANLVVHQLTNAPAKDSPHLKAIPQAEPQSDPLNPKELLSIEHYKGKLQGAEKEYVDKSKELQDLMHQEVTATVQLMGAKATSLMLQDRIDELQKDQKKRDVVDYLKKLKTDVDKLDQQDSKGIRIRIEAEHLKPPRIFKESVAVREAREPIENQLKIFDSAEDKLQSRLDELPEKVAVNNLKKLIEKEEEEIRKLNEELAQLRKKLTDSE